MMCACFQGVLWWEKQKQRKYCIFIFKDPSNFAKMTDYTMLLIFVFQHILKGYWFVCKHHRAKIIIQTGHHLERTISLQILG